MDGMDEMNRWDGWMDGMNGWDGWIVTNHKIFMFLYH